MWRRALFVLFCFAPAFVRTAHAESLWLVSNGFHTSIGVRAIDVPHDVRALAGDPNADHLLFGWGAAIYYTAPKVTPTVFCRATFLPTASAVHVVPVQGPFAQRFAHSDIFRFEVPRERMRHVSQFLRDSVRRTRSGKPVLLGHGYFPGSRFYAGTEIFWVPITCNIWSARALREGGVRLPMACAFAAPNLVWLSRKRGVREQYRRLPVDGF
jgi:uncharacterized protein (TIGR02117 family)